MLDEEISRIGDAPQQHPIESVAIVQRPPRPRIAHGGGVEVAVLARAGLVDVDERQPAAIRPEALEQIAAEVELIEPPPAHALPGHDVARRDRILGAFEPHADRELGPTPVQHPDQQARRGREPAARPGRGGESWPASARDPCVEIAREEGRGHHHREAEEALRHEGERDEDDREPALGDVRLAARHAAQLEERPAEEDEREEIGPIASQIERQQLGDETKDRLVPLPREEAERLEHARGAVGIHEHDRDPEERRARQPSRARAPRDHRVEEIGASHDEAQRVGEVRLDPGPRDQREEQGRIAPGPGRAQPLVVPPGAPPLQRGDREREPHRRERLGPHLGALPIGEGADHEHDERREAARVETSRGHQSEAEHHERREPSPREETEDAADVPDRTEQQAESPRRRDAWLAVSRPGPDLGRGHVTQPPERASHREVLPEILLVDQERDREQDRRGRDRERRDPGRMRERKRRDARNRSGRGRASPRVAWPLAAPRHSASGQRRRIASTRSPGATRSAASGTNTSA